MTQPPQLAPMEMTVEAGDGLLLKGVLAYPELPVGASYPLAVLAHQYPATADSFAPLIDDLLDLGVAVLAFDERGHGASITGRSGSLVIDSPLGLSAEAFGEAFISSATKVGFDRIDDDVVRVTSWAAVQNFIDASRIMLVGASVGGTAVTLASTRLPGLKALLTFGAAGELVWGPDGRDKARKAMEKITAQSLHTSAENDAFDAATNARRWSEGLKQARTAFVPGTAHAMGIYYAIRDQVLEFVQKSLL
jgi:pimeloyl-ACP methyl ester carboxylesterase